MKLPSNMKHQFSEVPRADIPRSTFDRSHGVKTTLDADFLVPIYVDEVLPGDTFNMKMTGFARMATPIHPLMDNIYMDSFFFAVPYRLLWDNWQRFCGERDQAGDPESTDLIPQVDSPVGGWPEGSMGDYFGLPTKVEVRSNALPFRAMNLIYNEWFRDQNLQDRVTINTDDGVDTPTVYPLLRRDKRHDYFTSALPFPQKGEPVTVPLAGTAPVDPAGTADGSYGTGSVGRPRINNGTNILATTGGGVLTSQFPPGSTEQVIWVDPELEVSFNNASAFTINEMREAFQVQRMLERDARGGSRYTEIVQSHFGVTSPDARLQRPEFLGGGTSPVNFSSVPQTSETQTTPQGNLSAYGTSTLANHGFVKSFTEHSIIIGLVNVRADLTYQQGLHRMWSRRTRYDHYWPALSHLGEQEVLSKELYYDNTPDDETVFGYQERFAEYRYKPSQITGLFRSNASAPLDSWHLSQDFANRPVLANQFIRSDTPMGRVTAVPAEPDFIMDCYFNLRCARPIPTYGVPGLIDHF